MIATFLGTMGLPHVVVRFYTNPDGRRRPPHHARRARPARRLLPAAADLRRTRPGVRRRADRRAADVLVLELPRLMVDGLGGELLTGVVTAGAFAAFLSTSSGLAIAVSGVLTQDVLGWPACRGVSAFRVAAIFAVVRAPRGRGAGPRLSVARAVGLAFAVAASTFCPAAGARHLVARPHPGRRGRRAAHRRARRRRRRRLDAVRRSAGELDATSCSASRPPGACPWRSRRWSASRCSPARRARPRQPVHGPAAHPRGRPARPRLTSALAAARRAKSTAHRKPAPVRRGLGTRREPVGQVAPTVRSITSLLRGS